MTPSSGGAPARRHLGDAGHTPPWSYRFPATFRWPPTRTERWISAGFALQRGLRRARGKFGGGPLCLFCDEDAAPGHHAHGDLKVALVVWELTRQGRLGWWRREASKIRPGAPRQGGHARRGPAKVAGEGSPKTTTGFRTKKTRCFRETRPPRPAESRVRGDWHRSPGAGKRPPGAGRGFRTCFIREEVARLTRDSSVRHHPRANPAAAPQKATSGCIPTTLTRLFQDPPPPR